jgi:hypothetical protein
VRSGRSVLPGAYAAKARGLVLCALTAGTAYVYYLAVDADDAIPPAAADVIPPRVIAAPDRINGPVYVIPDGATHAPVADARTHSSGIARDIQTALVNARCYDGPITGDWTPASQAAMRTFLHTVKAQLPVAAPDPALLTLLTAHADATCGPAPDVVTGSLDTLNAAPKPPDTSRLDHAWAPAGMLIPPREPTTPAPLVDNAAAPPAATPAIVPPVAAQAVAPETSQSSPVVAKATSPTSNAELKLEDETLVAVREASPEARAEPARKASQRKAKVAKRRASRQSEQDFGMNFDSIQRSISSLFE